MNAPLSSPSQNQNPSFQNAYFSQSSQSGSSSSSSGNNPAQHQTQPQAQQQQYASPQQQHRPAHTDNTSHFLQDFNLVAEAAKRAQMAVLMRDLEAVGI